MNFQILPNWCKKLGLAIFIIAALLTAGDSFMDGFNNVPEGTHHYFKDFAYCDSGMIPWLLVAELMSMQNTPLSKMVDEGIAAYPCSGEINYKVSDTKKMLTNIRQYFSHLNPTIDTRDGLSMSFDNWRFNVRVSNTEPLLRLNIETKNDQNLVQEKVTEITHLIKN